MEGVTDVDPWLYYGLTNALAEVWKRYSMLSELADRDDVARGGDLLESLLDLIHSTRRDPEDEIAKPG